MRLVLLPWIPHQPQALVPINLKSGLRASTYDLKRFRTSTGELRRTFQSSSSDGSANIRRAWLHLLRARFISQAFLGTYYRKHRHGGSVSFEARCSHSGPMRLTTAAS